MEWTPSYVTENNLIHDIKSRIYGTMRPGPVKTMSSQNFVDKSSWILVGQAGAMSPIPFDSHGFGTFLLMLLGEVLLIFSNHIEDVAEREVVLDNIYYVRHTKEIQKVMKRQLRYVLLGPGMM